MRQVIFALTVMQAALQSTVVCAAQDAPTQRRLTREIVDGLLGGGDPRAVGEAVREYPRFVFDLFHDYLNGAIALDLDGSANRARTAWQVGEKLAPLYDGVRGGSRLRDSLARYRRLRADHARQKVDAEERLAAARTSLRRGEVEPAGNAAREALDLFVAIEDPRGAAFARAVLADTRPPPAATALALEDLDEAARLFAAAGDDWWAAATLHRLGAKHLVEERYAEALRIYRLAQAAFAKVEDEEMAWSARADIGAILHHLGLPRLALAELEPCLERQSRRKAPAARAHIAAQIGAALLGAGDHGGAIRSILDALRLLGDERRHCAQKARTVLQLGMAYDEIGLVDWADERLEEALQHAGDCAGEEFRDLCITARARVALDRGEPVAAMDLLSRLDPSTARTPSRRGERLRLEAVCRIETGAGGGLSRLEEARDVFRAAGMDLLEGMCEAELGEVLAAGGEAAKAAGSFTRALEVAPDHPEVVWRAWTGMGALREDAGDLDEALASYRNAVDVQEDLLARSGGPLLRQGFFSARERPYHRLTGLHLRRGDVRQALEVAERLQARAAAGHFRGAERALHAHLPDDLRRRQNDILHAIEECNRSLSLAGGEVLEELTAKRDALRREYRDLLVRAELESPRLAGLLGVFRPADVEAIRERLAAGGERDAVLVYQVTDEVVHLWTVLAGGLSYQALDCDRRGLGERVERLRGEFARFEQGIADLSSIGFDARNARELYRLLVEPVAADLESVSRLLVVPDGPLHHLPFEALVLEGTPGRVQHDKLFRRFRACRYLVERWSVSYLPSLRFAAPGAGSGARGDGEVLVLADPATNGATSESGMRAQRLGPLPSAAREGTAIQELLGRPAVTLLRGNEATEAAFLEKAAGAGVLHLAAHAWVENRAPLFSGIQLAAAAGGDGVLEAHEVLRLDLPGPLVVLSGCETAGGPLRAGGGLQSMARAFLGAGARGVVASLWRVDDSTALLMEEFYRGLRDGRAPAAALRGAKIALLRRLEAERYCYALPYFWAPFVLIGSP